MNQNDELLKIVKAWNNKVDFVNKHLGFAMETGFNMDNEDFDDDNTCDEQYCLVCLTDGQYQTDVDGTRYSSVIGVANFDTDNWHHYDTLRVGALSISRKHVLSVLDISKGDYLDADSSKHLKV